MLASRHRRVMIDSDENYDNRARMHSLWRSQGLKPKEEEALAETWDENARTMGSPTGNIDHVLKDMEVTNGGNATGKNGRPRKPNSGKEKSNKNDEAFIISTSS